MKHISRADLIRLAAEELPDRLRPDLQAHLRACDLCRAACAEFSALRDLLGEWTVDAPSDDLLPAIEGRLDAPRPVISRPQWSAAARISRIAAAMLIGVGLGHLAGRLSRTAPTQEPLTVAQASEHDMAHELGLGVLESPTPAGLFTTVLDLTDASRTAEVNP
jgi:anti-sigma factor RsiW